MAEPKPKPMTDHDRNIACAQRLGWELVPDESVGCWWRVPEGSPFRDAFGSTDDAPDFCNDIAAAMGLLEAWRAKGGHWKLQSQDSGYGCYLDRWDGWGETATGAIVAAFLAANMGKEEASDEGTV